MGILPVIDLLNGVVVRGIAGQRSQYQPVQSRLTPSVQPLQVARAIRETFQLNRLYVADLDAIMYQKPNWPAYTELLDDGFELRVDAGSMTKDLARHFGNCDMEPIIGLETCDSPEDLEQVRRETGRVTFSLDLIDGRPMRPAGNRGWKPQPQEIAVQASQVGIERIIVLDLADVGTSSGGRTDDLCRAILSIAPKFHLTCGGGVRHVEDLFRIAELGAAEVLMASALHDGRLTACQLTQFSNHRDVVSDCP